MKTWTNLIFESIYRIHVFQIDEILQSLLVFLFFFFFVFCQSDFSSQREPIISSVGE